MNVSSCSATSPNSLKRKHDEENERHFNVSNHDALINTPAPSFNHTTPTTSTCSSAEYFLFGRGDRGLTVDQMAVYLSSREECDSVLTIFHTKVVVKSYTNEKRYFCPPPCIYLSGGGWKQKQLVINEYQQLKTSSEQLSSNLCAYIGIGQNVQDRQQLDFSKENDFSAGKMYITNSDKREYIELSVQLFYDCGIDIGHFYSSRIKVISKAPKIKTSTKLSDSKYLGIASGTKVALFNRTKSQDHKYLHVKENCFEASKTKWGAFSICLVDEPDDTPLESKAYFNARDGFVCYGSVIKLVDSASNFSLPKLIIRRVDKHQVCLDPLSHELPVSQLHKCAFEIVGEPMCYLALNQDTIIQHKAKLVDELHHQISDGAAWSIISADTISYRFYEAMGPVQSSITPVPVATSLEIVGSDSQTMLCIHGYNFKTNLQIWFATTPVETVWRSTESLVCMVPQLSTINYMFVNHDLEVPILLVRKDGVIYSTSITFSYKNMQIQ